MTDSAALKEKSGGDFLLRYFFAFSGAISRKNGMLFYGFEKND